MEKYIEIKNLNLYIDNKILLNNINISIDKPCKIGLIGKSGEGKSLFAYSLINSEIEYGARKIFDKISINGSENDYSENITYIPQEPLSSLNPSINIYDHFKINDKKRQTKKDLNIEIKNLLYEVGLSDFDLLLKKYPYQLSGGMAQRVLIALSLQNNPNLILADEATSSLDSFNQNKILKLLNNICNERSIGIIIISHNFDLVKDFCDILLKIENKNIREISKHDLDSDFYNNKDIKLNQKNKKILSINSLSISMDNTKILKNINLEIFENQTIGILGLSGSGKSTLVKTIIRQHDNYSGEIKLYGNEIKNYTYTEYSSIVQHVNQDLLGSLNPKKKIKDILFDLNKLIRKNKDVFNNLIFQYLKRLNLNVNIFDLYPMQLSGGQRQRVLIVKSLLWSPKFLIMDEPVSSLDPYVQLEIINIIKKLKIERNLTLLVVSHDINFINKICERVCILENGQIIEDGEVEEIINSPKNKYTKNLLIN
tara:strand:+ start:21407 stop:22858 length:1452 start_codon:yes stop_codon:yes gene_type:complete